LALVSWAARLGAITADALAERADVSFASARARLAAAERAGLLTRRSAVTDSPALYTATRLGLRITGSSSLGICRVSASNAAHLAACASVAAALESRYPDHRVIGERELRREERELGAPLASARLYAAGARGGLWHRPDLVLWPAAGAPTAVEVELTVKAPRRLQEVCRAWARARCVAGVIYLAAPGVEPALARAIARAEASERVVVVPLAAVCTRSCSAPACSRGDAREASQGVRTFSRRGSSI
jgi:DNA-binding Lrp family transcriptional regulator